MSGVVLIADLGMDVKLVVDGLLKASRTYSRLLAEGEICYAIKMKFVWPPWTCLFCHGKQVCLAMGMKFKCTDVQKECLIRLHKSCAHFQGTALFKQRTYREYTKKQ